MDSMRSLNTSLPKTGRPQPSPQPDITQSFRSAALSVTNLYKSAHAEIEKARTAGYQEALENLIHFLDKENLGVGDGEGWRVRQWATERWDGGPPVHTSSDSDDDVSEEKRARSSSPIMDRNSSPEETRSERCEPQASARSNSPSADLPGHATRRSPQLPPTTVSTQADPQADVNMNPPQASFSFRTAYPYPAATGNDSSPDQAIPARRSEHGASRRSSNRSQNRNNIRMAAANILSLGNGSGQKRKHPFSDLFNIDGLNDRRDGFGGGGKRGRTS